jgi:nitroreductase
VIDARVTAIIDVIRTRRSVRAYAEAVPPKAFLEQLIEVGRWAPTPGNMQSLRFVTIRNPANLSVLRDVSPGFPRPATSAIVICSDARDAERYSGTTRLAFVAEEASMAAQNMLLVAHAMGFGSCLVGSFSRAGVARALRLPEDVEPVLIVAVGVPSQQPLPPPRKPVESIVYDEMYQER